MVLEATFICVDNSEYMRNGDFQPQRLGAVCEACQLICGAKTQMNPENTVGLLTMAGKSVRVMETLTGSIGTLLAAISSINVQGQLHFVEGLNIAALGLKHRQNKQQRQRVVCFVGSPIDATAAQLEQLGKKLKKNSVAVDVVTFGVEENVPKLEALVNAVNSQENSHLIIVPAGVQLADVLVASPLVTGEDGAAPPRAGGGGGDFDFGVDPSQDPELAMALRMSMEEERRRQEAEAKARAEAGGAPAAAGDAPAAAQPMDEDLDEAAALELALKMSMAPNLEAGVDDLANDPAFMASLAAQLGMDTDAKEVKKEEDDQKEPK